MCVIVLAKDRETLLFVGLLITCCSYFYWINDTHAQKVPFLFFRNDNSHIHAFSYHSESAIMTTSKLALEQPRVLPSALSQASLKSLNSSNQRPFQVCVGDFLKFIVFFERCEHLSNWQLHWCSWTGQRFTQHIEQTRRSRCHTWASQWSM